MSLLKVSLPPNAKHCKSEHWDIAWIAYDDASKKTVYICANSNATTCLKTSILDFYWIINKNTYIKKKLRSRDVFLAIFFLFPDDKIHIDPTEFTFSQHAFEHWSILAGPEDLWSRWDDRYGHCRKYQNNKRHPKGWASRTLAVREPTVCMTSLSQRVRRANEEALMTSPWYLIGLKTEPAYQEDIRAGILH